MAFEVIPAIDVADGKLVRMSIGGPAVVDAFDADPIAAAESYVAAGARWLHVVDVDLAFTGELRCADVIRACAGLDVRVQASGGITTPSQAISMLSLGAERVVLGSGALADHREVAMILERLKERIVIGIETTGGRIRPRGRDAAIDLDLAETLSWLAELHPPRLLHTSVRRVGELAGPDLATLRTVLEAGALVVAAGGIASTDHLRDVRSTGAEGVVVGRAALDGDLDLEAAIRDLG
jgi:phosphoribosylformimino-5-aminoimidazole carboxamide ribonucleotide (ProFAR) isomerase